MSVGADSVIALAFCDTDGADCIFSTGGQRWTSDGEQWKMDAGGNSVLGHWLWKGTVSRRLYEGGEILTLGI